MPFTKKGDKIYQEMVKNYGVAKGKQVFYSSMNAGKITGVHKKKAKRKKTR